MQTDRAVVNLKPSAKSYKRYDAGGLHLYVSPSGGKLWRLTYRFNNKEKLLSLGAYPAVTLAKARQRRDEAKVLLADGIDPSDHKKALKIGSPETTENCFEPIAREWYLRFRDSWTKEHGEKILARLEKDVFPYIGKKPIANITPPELLFAIRRIEDRGALETAHRTLQICNKIFRYAVATVRANRDIANDLRGALPPVKAKHHSSVTDPKEVGKLLRDIDEYEGQFTILCALKLSPLFFVRPGELRCSEWSEFDFEKAEWRIPAERMKMREQHIVPLSRQALEILNDLRRVTGSGRYLFPSVRTGKRPISNNTLNASLRRIGYSKDEMTADGFRSMASTLLNEQGWNRDAIERQLAHAERSKVRAAYNFAEFLPERRIMMQVWADFLDGLRQDKILSPSELLTPEQIKTLRECSLSGIRFGSSDTTEFCGHQDHAIFSTFPFGMVLFHLNECSWPQERSPKKSREFAWSSFLLKKCKYFSGALCHLEECGWTQLSFIVIHSHCIIDNAVTHPEIISVETSFLSDSLDSTWFKCGSFLSVASEREISWT